MISSGYSSADESAHAHGQRSRGLRIRMAAVFWLAQACVVSLGLKLFAAEIVLESYVLDNFEGYAIQTFPPRWRARNDKAQKIYRIESENAHESFD
jgi:hypothetical protein